MKTKTSRLEIHTIDPPRISATAYNQQGSLAGRVDLAIAVVLVFGLIVGLSFPFFGAHGERSENPTILLVLVGISGLLLSFIVSPVVVSFVRYLRRNFGIKRKCTIKTEEGTLRGQRQLSVGETILSAGEVESIMLLGWQEETGEDRVWDLTAVCSSGTTIDIVAAYRDQDDTRKLGEAIAATLAVEFKESSVVGGQMTPDDPKPMVRRPEIPNW